MKKNQLKEIVPKKKNGAGKKILKIVAVIGAIEGIYQLYRKHKDNGKETQSIGPGEKKIITSMNGKRVSYENEYIKKLTVRARLGGVDIDLDQAKLANDTYIYMDALMSGICIRVPEKVNVVTEVKSVLAGVNNTVPKYLDDTTPIVHIIGKNVMSGLDIRTCLADEDYDVTMNVTDETTAKSEETNTETETSKEDGMGDDVSETKTSKENA